MLKKLIALLALGLFFAFNAHAAMVSFLVIETGINEADETKKEHTLKWENYLLDVFFEAGHIVSNAPIIRLSQKPSGELPKEAKAEFLEAAEVGIEYFIVAQIDYSGDSREPKEISFKLFKMLPSPYKKIHEKKFAGKIYKTAGEEINDLKKMVGELIPLLNN